MLTYYFLLFYCQYIIQAKNILLNIYHLFKHYKYKMIIINIIIIIITKKINRNRCKFLLKMIQMMMKNGMYKQILTKYKILYQRKKYKKLKDKQILKQALMKKVNSLINLHKLIKIRKFNWHKIIVNNMMYQQKVLQFLVC